MGFGLRDIILTKQGKKAVIVDVMFEGGYAVLFYPIESYDNFVFVQEEQIEKKIGEDSEVPVIERNEDDFDDDDEDEDELVDYDDIDEKEFDGNSELVKFCTNIESGVLKISKKGFDNIEVKLDEEILFEIKHHFVFREIIKKLVGERIAEIRKEDDMNKLIEDINLFYYFHISEK